MYKNREIGEEDKKKISSKCDEYATLITAAHVQNGAPIERRDKMQSFFKHSCVEDHTLVAQGAGIGTAISAIERKSDAVACTNAEGFTLGGIQLEEFRL